MGPNVDKIKKELKRLRVPRQYWGIDLDSFFTYQWNIYLSVREVAGKTTQSILLGLILFKLYPERYQIEYLRWDNSQIVRGSIETIFDTIIRFGYIEKIFEGKYNAVEYKYQTHKFYLCKKDGDGNILEMDESPCMVVHSVEKWLDIKSSYNAAGKGNYIVLDECFDTKRPTYSLFVQLLNVVSTIGRPLSGDNKDWLHILLLGNNTDEYSFLFDDFMLDASTLDYGGVITFQTEYNTTGLCRLLELGEEQKKRLEDRNIPFLGFPGKKAASFTGATAFSGKSYRHIDFELNYEYCKFRRVYIRHRGRYMQLDLFNTEEKGYFVFVHFAAPPKYDDNLILTLEPETPYELYGFGKYCKKDRVKKVLNAYTELLLQHRFYYASNKVGSLVDDFIQNID